MMKNVISTETTVGQSQLTFPSGHGFASGIPWPIRCLASGGAKIGHSFDGKDLDPKIMQFISVHPRMVLGGMAKGPFLACATIAGPIEPMRL